jgi:hypothetical protein
VIDKLNAAVVEAMKDPAVMQRLAAMGPADSADRPTDASGARRVLHSR